MGPNSEKEEGVPVGAWIRPYLGGASPKSARCRRLVARIRQNEVDVDQTCPWVRLDLARAAGLDQMLHEFDIVSTKFGVIPAKFGGCRPHD